MYSFNLCTVLSSSIKYSISVGNRATMLVNQTLCLRKSNFHISFTNHSFTRREGVGGPCTSMLCCSQNLMYSLRQVSTHAVTNMYYRYYRGYSVPSLAEYDCGRCNHSFDTFPMNSSLGLMGFCDVID